MQIGEKIAALVATPDSDEPCWACEEPPAGSQKNDLDEQPSSMGDAENDLHNDSSKLGKNLGFRPSWQVKVPHVVNGDAVTVTAPVTPAAHHVIPGNASLAKTPKLLDLMEKKRGKVRDDIGYDVNSAQNGVWLPGNYGVSKDSMFSRKWSDYVFKLEYAMAAMNAARAQFHDSHPIYSAQVKQSLRALADKITLHAPERCGICGKELSDKSRPPYGLVGRLNRLAAVHKMFLRGPVRKWPVSNGYFTSAWSTTKAATGT
ncbi:MAG: AHH domain-containing protein [Myxococcales bacterium]|nr:AHH domain-containing protein [Myxococcales bacterium]